MNSMIPTELSIENVSVVIGITLLSVYYIFIKETRKLPQTTNLSLSELGLSLTNGNAHLFLLQCMKDYGPVFRFSLPQLNPFVVVCDPDFARKIFDEEDEKPQLFKKMDGVTGGVSTIFSKRTHGNGHHKVRKCLAPSFSLTNIYSSLPKLHAKIDILKKIFLQNEKDNVSFDVLVIFPRLLMDMLCTAMFDIDFHILEYENGEGRQLMGDLHTAYKEFSKSFFDPLLCFMFWKKEQIDAKATAVRIKQCQQKLLDNYRANNTPEEIEKGVSIMAQNSIYI
jgi:cytochrome P450